MSLVARARGEGETVWFERRMTGGAPPVGSLCSGQPLLHSSAPASPRVSSPTLVPDSGRHSGPRVSSRDSHCHGSPARMHRPALLSLLLLTLLPLMRESSSLLASSLTLASEATVTTNADRLTNGLELPLYAKNFVITCNNSDPKVRLDHWTFNGYELRSSEELGVRMDNMNNSVVIATARKHHEGNYTCVFTNGEEALIRVKGE